MLIHECGRVSGVLALGTATRMQVSNRVINGLLVATRSVATISKIAITAILRPANGPSKILLNAIPCSWLAEISDLRQGNSFSLSLGELDQDALAAGEAVSALAIDKGAFTVDLGEIHITDGDELDVVVHTTTALLAADGFAVASYQSAAASGAEKVKRFERVDGDPTAKFSDPEAVWACWNDTIGAEDQAAPLATGATLTAEVRLGDGETCIVPADLAWAATACLCETETGPRRILGLYMDPTSSRPGEDVSITLSGTDRAKWSLLAEVFDQDIDGRGSNKAVAAVEKQAQAAARVEAKSPALARALRHQGRIKAKSSELMKSAKYLKARNAFKGLMRK